MRLAHAIGSLALVTLASAPALADCIPGTGLCASASAGVAVGIPVLPLPQVRVNGQITVGIPPFIVPVPGAAPVAPAPEVAPPPVYQYQPPPQVYVYGPPAPRYGYAPVPAPAYGYAPNYAASRLGLDVRVDGAGGFAAGHAAYGLGGVGLGLRYRATPHLGLELGADVLGGTDYNGNKRTEVSGNAGALLYVNPRSRAQFYLSGGLLVDHARASGTESSESLLTSNTPSALQYNHVGGYAGLGLEIFATRHLSFHLDARGVMRQAVGGNTPEFTNASGQTTNTSAGVVGSAGMVFYF